MRIKQYEYIKENTSQIIRLLSSPEAACEQLASGFGSGFCTTTARQLPQWLGRGFGTVSAVASAAASAWLRRQLQ
ncbi:hypothetical protein [Paenibacillus mesotrionivorans]|uniref:Uncharacterized protein n=1 Tax=Paenibacillus mesotrionivorans TaxID=3160968 RepID=A0ACC7P215_9BACL